MHTHGPGQGRFTGNDGFDTVDFSLAPTAMDVDGSRHIGSAGEGVDELGFGTNASAARRLLAVRRLGGASRRQVNARRKTRDSRLTLPSWLSVRIASCRPGVEPL